MRVAYIAPRFHTNHVPIIKGWVESGDEVIFISEFVGKSEDYTYCTPYVVGYSKIFMPILGLYKIIKHRKLTWAVMPTYFQVNYGLPPLVKIHKIFKKFKPDVVIIRDRSVYTAIVTQYCRMRKIKIILYNQTPYWEKKEEKTDILHRIIRGLCPKERITPVYGKKEANSIVVEGSYYVPFVMQKYTTVEEKTHFRNNKIQIICVGKFEEVKHHIELVQLISELPNRDKLHLTLVGECSRISHEEYMARLRTMIQSCNMTNQVTIKMNLTQADVYKEYAEADLFVLPSAGDFASIAQLEAMACSLPIICSDGNGTANCVEDGVNGYCFQGLDFGQLKEIIASLTIDKDRLYKMGEASYRLICEKYQFENYKSEIFRIIKEK